MGLGARLTQLAESNPDVAAAVIGTDDGANANANADTIRMDALFLQHMVATSADKSGTAFVDSLRSALAMLPLQLSSEADIKNAVFVHVPEEDDDDVPARYRTFRTDCLRSAVGRARALTCERNVKVMVVHSGPAVPQGRGSGIKEMIDMLRMGEVTIMAVNSPSETVRLAVMALCGMGGVLGGLKDGGKDELGAWAVRVSGGYGYAATPQPGADAVWMREGDILSARPMIDRWANAGVLDAARTNMAGCPPIIWINLDRHEARREHVETQLRALGVRWHSRVRAIDAADPGQLERRLPRMHPTGTAPENACTASHILAMERYLSEFPEEPCVIVVEDDISFEFAADWPKPMKAYIEQANAEHPGWRVIQLGGIVCERSDLAPPIICKDRAVPRIRTNWFSTVGYAITREAAKDFVGWYHRTGGVVDLGELVHDQCTCVHPEFVIYSRPRSTLFAPLFSFIGTDSDLNPSNPIAHSIGRGYLLHYWGTVVM